MAPVDFCPSTFSAEPDLFEDTFDGIFDNDFEDDFEAPAHFADTHYTDIKCFDGYTVKNNA